MKKKNKPKVDTIRTRGVAALPPTPKFDVDEIAKRLKYVNIEELLQMIFEAIDGAKGMAESLPPEECDEDRATLEQLRKTVVFVFGAERANG